MLNQLTISGLTGKLAKRECSAREATRACLDQIQRVDGRIKAFLGYDAVDALAQAEAADKAIADGADFKQRPLLGVPVAVKDVLCVKGHPCNCGRSLPHRARLSPASGSTDPLLCRNPPADLPDRAP